MRGLRESIQNRAHGAALKPIRSSSEDGIQRTAKAQTISADFGAKGRTLPEVSVIVVNWNRCELLRACLQSLCSQCRDGYLFEIIIVDNGSVDGSVEMLKHEFSNRDNICVHLIVNQENRGFCAANNQGISAARGRFIALLNNDAEAEPGWISALRRAFEISPEVGMAASKILVHNNRQKIDKVGHQIYPDGLSRGRGCGELDFGQYDRFEDTLWPDGCAAMYRKKMLDEIGGFDEDFFAYADDAELGLRARIAGWRCIYVPTAVVFHHRGATLGVTSLYRLALIERNRILLAAKLFPWSLLCLNSLYYLARIAVGLRAAILNKGEISRYVGVWGKINAAAALIRGDVEAIGMLPRMLRKRRDIDNIRKLSPGQVRALILDHRIRLRILMEQAT
jgi:GT2 family glycosyltransferase